MSQLSAKILSEIEKYEQGPQLLAAALAGFPADRLQEPLPPGAWSAQQVVCHLSDFEVVYGDRLKAVIAEDGPQLPARDEQRFATRLGYEQRSLPDEMALIEQIRRQVARLLRSLDVSDFRRVGIHSVDGPLTLEELLGRIAGHVPHHADFIERKKRLLLKPA